MLQKLCLIFAAKKYIDNLADMPISTFFDTWYNDKGKIRAELCSSCTPGERKVLRAVVHIEKDPFPLMECNRVKEILIQPTCRRDVCGD